MRSTELPYRETRYAVAFLAHTVAVYLCAIHLSPWLVGRWFAWIAPRLNIPTNANGGNWYLQHLVWMTIVPALVVGCLATRIVSPSTAVWAWLVPTVVVIFKILAFHGASSVLVVRPISAFRYYFEIQRVMPDRTNFLAVDVARVLAQMIITAPFLAGVAYSLGAGLAKITARSLHIKTTTV